MAVTLNASASAGFVTTADTSTILQLQTNSTAALTVNASQNVGIGTANTPSNRDTVTPKIIVNGAGVAGSMQVVRNTTPGSGGAILELTSTRGSDVNSYTIVQSGDGVGSVIFGGADGTQFTPAASIVASVDGTPGANDMPGRLVFNTTADGASLPTERMRIDSSGNLLVGTTSLNGTNGFSVAPSTSPYVTLNKTASGGFDAFKFQYNSTGVGSISYTNTAVAFNTSSDYRLKENIAPLTGALTKVAALKPVTYKWKSDGSDGEGFIAHELAEVCPHAVTGEKDAVDENGNPIYQGIDTSFLVATLTAALQEAYGLIKDLQVRVNALEAK